MKRFSHACLIGSLVLGFVPAIFAAGQNPTATTTGTSTQTSTTQGTGTRTGVSTSASTRSMGAENSMAKPMAAPSPAKTSAVSAPQNDFVYVNDQDTDALQRAIEAYNRRYPNEPIRISNYSGELSGEILERLLKYEFLKQAPPNVGNMRIVDGRIMRRVPRSQAEQKPGEKGDSADSMGGMLEAAARKLDQQSPRNVGNEAGPSDVQLEQRRVAYRRRNGEYVEKTYQVPRIPKPGKVSLITGRAVAKPNDMLRRSVLPARLKTQTTTIPVTNEAPQKLPPAIASGTQ